MKQVFRTTIAFVTAFVMAVTGAFMFNGVSSPVYADVGSVQDDEDVTYDKDGGVLSSIGIDTSKMPEDYDPDSTSNPYGSDVMNMNAVYELFQFITVHEDALLYGHNVKLDGKYETLTNMHTAKGVSTPDFTEDTFASCAACDVKGTGRKSALAIVYTNYNPLAYSPEHSERNNIYLVIFDPLTGSHSDPIKLSNFIENRITVPYLVQSQLQVTCGDYDNDTVDEIAVYVPAASDNERAKVSVFDLVNGQDAQDPFRADAWNLSWNYVLPVTSESSKIIGYMGKDAQGHDAVQYLKNFYNNIDLVSGDADNDGPCDLIISYGASSTGSEVGEVVYDKILRSIESHSILLYGSNQGQMLKKSQKISYDDNDLIRVSCAFGDLDDDGNEELLLGGQMKSEQGANTTRVLGKFLYDGGSGTMVPEQIQDMKVVDGEVQKDGSYSSSNGWDQNYYSTPVMKANIAVGKFFGEQSDKRIYLDSVLYSYNGSFAIEDELEDRNTEKDKDNHDIPKGSQAMADMMGAGEHSNEQWEYFEYGAQAANFTGGDFDYGLINRVSKPRTHSGQERMQAVATKLVVSGDDLDSLTMSGKNESWLYEATTKNAPFIWGVPDTDIDGTVAEYTGSHKIVYENPKVVAVLASSPYFKDVANYDDSMLGNCSTGFGSGSGTDQGYEYTEELEVGIVGDIDFAAAHFFVDGDMGKKWTWEWGKSTTKEFTMSYETEGGEDAVVLQSTPREYFEYNVTSVMVDDDGTLTEYTETMYIKNPHQPVTQTLTMEDYIEIQKEYSDELPDVKDYYSSRPGDPSTYPKDDSDIPDAAKKHLKKNDDGETMLYAAPDFAGIAFGGGSVSQSFTVTNTESKRSDNRMEGMFQEVNAGGQGGVENIITIKVGIHEGFDRAEGSTLSTTTTEEYSCQVANMPRSAKDYGYDFSWKLFEYTIDFTNEKGLNYDFPVVTYIVDDVLSPPMLPDPITQDFDNTTDTQTALTWTYNTDTPQEFLIYKYLDFPQGGGDLLAGRVAGSEYKIKKDENGKTVRDQYGNVVREYTFLDKNLTPDTKYQYRVKTRRSKFPQESIFSPVIEARTDVSQKPDVNLTSDSLKIYPDGVFRLGVVLADPEHYEGTINYQWQKYDKNKRIWNDVADCTKQAVAFYKCTKDDAGIYRCRVNLIRKVESHPQYITTYTDSCTVAYSKRSVKFGPISVFESEGSAPVNTGISVSLSNSSAASVEKPSGTVQFKIEGANATIYASTQIDETTGIARINSIEEGMGSLDLAAFTDGGYKVTASYKGSGIFYAADDPEEYHYLRNIEECLWLSARSSYIFGEDLMRTTKLYDYKKTEDGVITRTDVTDTVKKVDFYAVDEHDHKLGDSPLYSCVLADNDGKACLPLNKNLAKRAYIEVFTNETGDAAGHAIFDTEKMITKLSLKDKMTGTGNLLEFYQEQDIKLSGDGNLTEKNIITDGGSKSLADLIKFRYYEANGDFMYDSTQVAQHKDEFIPADYVVKLECPDLISTFFKMKLNSADFVIVGNYYKVSAACSDPNAGIISMISPDADPEYEETGYAGGTKLIFKAVPDRGYQVKRWKINECGENETILPASDTIAYTVKSQTTAGNGKIAITAILEPKANSLSYGVKGHGTVTVDPSFESGSTVIANQKLTFKATPDDGWKFVEWKWTNDGGNNSIAKGTMAEDGTNTKTFTMPDNSASVFAIFMKETIDIDLHGALNAAYINDGSNPLEENSKQVDADSGQDVPKGVQVIISTKKGYTLAPGEDWTVNITTPDGTRQAEVEKCLSGGQDACRFMLPEDVTACEVFAETQKGKYSVDASAEDVAFAVKVDGAPAEGAGLTGISGGSSVEITAVPNRGRVLQSWTVNGEKIDSKDLTYTTTITGNLNVTAATDADTKLNLKLKTEGGGTAKYVITDKNGDTHTENFGAQEITPDLYKGESLIISAADNETKHTLTSVTLNGRTQALEDDVFELKDITTDTDLIGRFTASTYHSVTINDATRDVETVIMDENNIPLEEGETISVPDGGTAVFKVAIQKASSCFVYNGETEVAYTEKTDYGTDQTLYTYQIDGIDKKTALTVTNYKTYNIGTPAELQTFFNDLSQQASHTYTSAVLTADIEMPSNSRFVEPYKGIYDGEFDGKGHTIKGVNSGQSLFNKIGPSGCVKDVVLENAYNIVFDENSFHGGAAVITCTNMGTITGVELKNAVVHLSAYITPQSYTMAGLAVDNEGTIADCKVSGLKLVTALDPSQLTDPLGCAGVIVNQAAESGKAVMKDNYFEGLERGRAEKMVDSVEDLATADPADLVFDALEPASSAIVADPTSGVSHGSFHKEQTYFKAKADTEDPHGTSVYTLTDNPEKVGTAALVTYTMNHVNGEKVWGVSSAADTAFTQILNGGEGYKAPVKAVFKTTGETQTVYLYPGPSELPGTESFGENTPAAWENGDRAYTPGYVIDIMKDTEFTGISNEIIASDYTASIATTVDSKPVTLYFKELSDALQTAETHNSGHQQLNIFGTCEMADLEFTIDSDTVMTLQAGAKLTMKESASIINKGKIVCSTESKLHKYGMIQNTGTIDIAGENLFYNYGSKLTGNGTIDHPEFITCNPHCNDVWTQADKPNPDGTWTKTSTCDICGKEISKSVAPNPAPGAIEQFRLLTGPDKTVYEVGETFSDQGMLLIAEMTDGDKAVITEYKMTVDGKEIKAGTPLDTEGEFEVAVSYEDLTCCTFGIEVRNTADLLTITDTDNREITETELQINESIDLTASLKHKLAEKHGFKWETDNPKVAALDGTTTAKDRTIRAGQPGQATITVTVVDENGAPIAAIDPKTVAVTVVSHVTALKIVGGDKVIDAAEPYQLEIKVTPQNTTDELTWTSTDEVVATVDQYGLVTPKKGGKTIITVMSPGGVSASCKVSVYEKAGTLTLDADNLQIATSGFSVLSARVEPASANGEVTWTTDNAAVAGFYVENSKTGEMEIVPNVTTKLSADESEFSDAYVIIAGAGAGDAVITATTEGRDGSTLEQTCAVQVSDTAKAVKITHNGALASGKLFSLDLAGRMIQMKAESSEGEPLPEGDLTWTRIDDEQSPVIRVNSTGSVELLRKGTAALMVTSDSLQSTDVCMFNIRIAAAEIVLSKDDVTLTKRDHMELNAQLLPEGAEDDLTWTSTNDNVATVSAAGEITAVSKGTATINVTTAHGGVAASCQVTVKDPTYTVTFVDGQGNTLKKQTVVEGSDAKAPADPTRKGYLFDGWDRGFTNITKNLTVTAKWKKQISLKGAKVVLSKTKYTYNGKVQKPAIKTIGGKTLKAGTDYTVKWSNSKPKSVGPYTVTITGKGLFVGTTKATFKINPKGTKIKKLTAGKKSIKVKWMKCKKKMSSSRITGYQVQVATNKKFTKNKKTKKVKGYKKTTKTFKNLKGGKKYYVRVRTYKTIKGVKYYSPWSKVKKITTKR